MPWFSTKNSGSNRPRSPASFGTRQRDSAGYAAYSRRHRPATLPLRFTAGILPFGVDGRRQLAAADEFLQVANNRAPGDFEFAGEGGDDRPFGRFPEPGQKFVLPSQAVGRSAQQFGRVNPPGPFERFKLADDLRAARPGNGFSVTALGCPSPTYQWWWNGTNQVGGNSPTLTLTGVGRAQNGIYALQVMNSFGGILSSNAALRVLVPQQLGTPALLPNGTLQFSSADVGGGTLLPSDLTNFGVQVSSNLVYWVTLPNALGLTNGTLLLQDSTLTNAPVRFYRIVEH